MIKKIPAIFRSSSSREREKRKVDKNREAKGSLDGATFPHLCVCVCACELTQVRGTFEKSAMIQAGREGRN